MSLKKYRLHVYKRLIIVFLQSLFMNAVIIQSNEQKERWLGTGRLKRTKIVPIGFNSKKLYPISENEKLILRKQKGIELGQIVLIYAGAISRTRNLRRLFESIKEVGNQFENIRLVMVGDGDAFDDLKVLAIRMKIDKYVTFTGRVAYDEMVEYYGIADIGISYIPINKNFNYNPPLKTYEYLACGLPCVATSTVSNCMIVKDKSNGILTEDSVQSIANGIISLLKNKDILENIKLNARKSVASHSFDIIAERYLMSIYEDVLSLSLQKKEGLKASR
jgi:glycosyltransferase involved in cell wall biosynthesis